MINNRWLAILSLSLVLPGCQARTEPEPTRQPEFISISSTDIGADKVTLTAIVSEDISSCEGYFELSGATSAATSKHKASIEKNSVRCSVSDLTQDSEYTFRAIIDNLRGSTISSEAGSFTTKKAQEFLSFEDAYLKSYLLARYDTDSDSEISPTEAKLIDKIEVNSDNVHTLKGIENLPNLLCLQAGGTCKESFGTGNLSEAELSGNPRLEELGLEGNQIQHISLASQTRLRYLSLSRNPIKELTISKMKSLSVAGLSCMDIKTLDLRGLDELDEMHLDGNVYLTELLLENQKLRYLDCSGCALSVLDISKCPALDAFDCGNNPSLEKLRMSRKQTVSGLRKDDHTEIEYVD